MSNNVYEPNTYYQWFSNISQKSLSCQTRVVGLGMGLYDISYRQPVYRIESYDITKYNTDDWYTENSVRWIFYTVTILVMRYTVFLRYTEIWYGITLHLCNAKQNYFIPKLFKITIKLLPASHSKWQIFFFGMSHSKWHICENNITLSTNSPSLILFPPLNLQK